MGLFENRTGIAIWDIEAMANQRQSGRSKDRNIIEKRRKLRGAALKKIPLIESERVQGGDSFSLADYVTGRVCC